MKLYFEGDIRELEMGIFRIQKLLAFEPSSEGLTVKVIKTEDPLLTVSVENDHAVVSYKEKIHFFRGLGLLLEGLRDRNEFRITERPQFKSNGAMFDCSRNAVLRPSTVKEFVRYMAVMGLNMLMLYTEDTYTIEDEPYFGYMRGRFSPEELKDLDDYADSFGIEIIPCIQTLAHLSSYLKWTHTASIKDTDDVLLVREKKTYEFIDKMIYSASSPFRSKRIHIGMDEAHGLGRGSFLDRYGKEDRFALMTEHLQKVARIASKYNLKPMVWSDMYFRVWSEANAYYDLEIEIPPDVRKEVPSEVQLVYWDYYNEEESFYRAFLKKHADFSHKPIFAGGIWSWHGPVIHFEKTFNTTNPALNACKEEGVEEVFATLWGDDGAECSYFQGLPGLQLFAEHGYAEKVDEEKVKRRFEFCTGGDFEAFYTIGKMDLHPSADWHKLIPDNPTKFLLWQDILLGLFDKQIEGLEFSQHYASISNELKNFVNDGSRWSSLYKFGFTLSSFLKNKSEIGLKISELYKKNSKVELKELAQIELGIIFNQARTLKEEHRNQWFENNKAFGWEVLDFRYGGMLARIETIQKRILDFADGRISKLEELEEDKLAYDSYKKADGKGVGKANKHLRIASANSF